MVLDDQTRSLHRTHSVISICAVSQHGQCQVPTPWPIPLPFHFLGTRVVVVVMQRYMFEMFP